MCVAMPTKNSSAFFILQRNNILLSCEEMSDERVDKVLFQRKQVRKVGELKSLVKIGESDECVIDTHR